MINYEPYLNWHLFSAAQLTRQSIRYKVSSLSQVTGLCGVDKSFLSNSIPHLYSFMLNKKPFPLQKKFKPARILQIPQVFVKQSKIFRNFTSPQFFDPRVALRLLIPYAATYNSRMFRANEFAVSYKVKSQAKRQLRFKPAIISKDYYKFYPIPWLRSKRKGLSMYSLFGRLNVKAREMIITLAPTLLRARRKGGASVIRVLLKHLTLFNFIKSQNFNFIKYSRLLYKRYSIYLNLWHYYFKYSLMKKYSRNFSLLVQGCDLFLQNLKHNLTFPFFKIPLTAKSQRSSLEFKKKTQQLLHWLSLPLLKNKINDILFLSSKQSILSNKHSNSVENFRFYKEFSRYAYFPLSRKILSSKIVKRYNRPKKFFKQFKRPHRNMKFRKIRIIFLKSRFAFYKKANVKKNKFIATAFRSLIAIKPLFNIYKLTKFKKLCSLIG